MPSDKTLLDDFLPADVLASLKAKRIKREKVDLSDLAGEAPAKPPAIEILAPVAVLLYVQENTCRCGRVSEIPLGLVAMHACKRNGRSVADRIGLALQEPNEFPHIPREREVHRGTSIVCTECVEVARLTPKPPHVYVAPKPHTPEWLEQCLAPPTAEQLEKLRSHEHEERLRRSEERLSRLEAIAENHAIVESFASGPTVDPEPELTLPEDSQ